MRTAAGNFPAQNAVAASAERAGRRDRRYPGASAQRRPWITQRTRRAPAGATACERRPAVLPVPIAYFFFDALLKFMAAKPRAAVPGTKFIYNTADADLAGA